MRLSLIIPLACGAWLTGASSAAPCSVSGTLPTATELVDKADVIVVAVARELVPMPKPPIPKGATSSLPALPPSPFQPVPSPPPPPYPDPSRSDRIRFEVKETLKGEPVTDLLFVGRVSARDDFNDTPETVNEIRPDGRGGSCYAESYRLGATYLLLLKQIPGTGLAPYWTPLSRLNDQIRPAGDRWLEWVRRRLALRRGVQKGG